MNVSVVGLGKLGLPLAVWLAEKHYVVGVDVNPETLLAVSSGNSPISEPGVQEALESAIERDSISFMSDAQQAAMETDVTFIVVPTPSDDDGRFELTYVRNAAIHISLALAQKDTYHLVVITSTVMPGDTGKIKEVLERGSGKTCGVYFGLCYNPEFIALGSVLHDLVNPDLVLIGESDENAGDQLQGIYDSIYSRITNTALTDTSLLNPHPQLCRTNFINAEIAKLALNTYITAKISYANLLGEYCERFTGADVDAVTDIIGADSRIGHKYLKAGPPFGGPCFPRDVKAFNAAPPDEHNWLNMNINEGVLFGIRNKILRNARADDVVGILGMAYKPGTSVSDESASRALWRELSLTGSGCRPIVWYDPLVDDMYLRCPTRVDSLEEVLQQANVLVVMLPLGEFKEMDLSDSPVHAIVDPWRHVDESKLPKSIKHIPLGRGPSAK